MIRSKWLGLFYIAATFELGSILLDVEFVHRVAKPMLMISLLIYFLTASKNFPKWRLPVMLALVFSLAGDVFLMADDMFIAGLGSFLVAHIFYITAYLGTGAANGKLRPLDALKFVVIGIALIWVLYPGLEKMLVPVVVYAIVLLGMATLAHKRRGATSGTSFNLVSWGALFFVASDAMIAINKFAYDVPAERILVMSTYIIAQYLIIQGLLAHDDN